MQDPPSPVDLCSNVAIPEKSYNIDRIVKSGRGPSPETRDRNFFTTGPNNLLNCFICINKILVIFVLTKFPLHPSKDCSSTVSVAAFSPGDPRPNPS